MTYNVEIMLRGNEKVFTETVHHIGGDDPSIWTTEDASTVLHSTLEAIDRVLNPDRTGDAPTTSLRGINWIVSPYQGGVVVALEIHSASAVAGPFRMPQEKLESLLAAAIATPLNPGGVVH